MNKQSQPRARKAGKSPPPAPAAKTARKTTASKRASPSRRAGKDPQVDGDARRAMIAQAAYFRAEKRGFACGGELDDWFEAEREISHLLDE